MKLIHMCLLSLIAITAYAADSDTGEQSALEGKLRSIELRTSKFISGKEKIASGYANMAPNVRQIACQAYPVASDKDTIKDLRKEIAFLERKKNIVQLGPEQIARLSAQKDIVAKLTPGIDCSALK